MSQARRAALLRLWVSFDTRGRTSGEAPTSIEDDLAGQW
jgi:hypothetical protein